jgi:hypothetical protein
MIIMSEKNVTAVATIYGLYDPRTDELRYVGSTTHTLAERRAGHMSDVYGSNPDRRKAFWLRELVDLGLKPVIKAIESVPQDRREIRELFWIRHFKAKGCELTNRKGMGDTYRKRPIPKEVIEMETQKTQPLTPSELSSALWLVAAREMGPHATPAAVVARWRELLAMEGA